MRPAASPPPAVLVPLSALIGLCCGVTVLMLTVFNYLVEPIGRDLALSAPQVSLALSLHLLALICALPVAGLLTDRLGPRAVIGVSGLAFGACLAAAAFARDRTALYTLFALAGAKRV